MKKQRLQKDDVSLLVIDVQERLCAAMEKDACERMVRRTVAAIEGAKALSVPVIATEQYPKGLGPSVLKVVEALGRVKPVEKVDFSCGAVPDIVSALGQRKQVLIAGMETHVCVFQTVRDLVDKGYAPFVCVDAVLSRTEEDRRVGLELCRDAGAVITSVEAALFDLLGKAGTPEFKRVSAAVK